MGAKTGILDFSHTMVLPVSSLGPRVLGVLVLETWGVE